MSIFSVGAYLAERKKYNFKTYTIEGVEFDLIPLTDDLIQELKMSTTYDETLLAAANFGISAGRNRACDDDEMAVDLDGIWGLEQLSIECEPSLQHKVGEKVCDISGLTSYIEDKQLAEEIKAEEEAKKLKVGDHLIPGDADIDNMTQEQMAQHHKDNAET
jgi:hypothetical protein